MLLKRVIFVLGTWQLIIATSAIMQESSKKSTLSKDYLVLYGHDLTEQMKESMQKLSTLLWDWAKVIWVDDLLNTKRYTEEYRLDIFKALKSRIGLKNADELWVSKLFNPLEKIAIDTYEDSPIVLYEDGLWVFAPQKLYSREFSSRFLLYPRKLIKLIKSKQIKKKGMLHYKIKGVRQDHLQRLKMAYLYLSKYMSAPKYLENIPKEQILSENIRSALYKARENIYEKVIVKENKNSFSNSFLVLAQNFSKNNKMVKRNEELNCYLYVVTALINQGYKVYWKEHPRTNWKFFEEISSKLNFQQLNNFYELEVPFSYPVELFVEELNIKGCVSCTSSALFSIRDLFDIPTFTAVDHIRKFRSRDYRAMAKLVRNEIPVFDMLFK